MAQPGSATVLGTVGRWFESNRPDHPQSSGELAFRLQEPRSYPSELDANTDYGSDSTIPLGASGIELNLG